MLPIILASSSPYRRQLLARLEIGFECISPDIDESAQGNETPQQLVSRLAEQKALAVAATQPQSQHLIIASDQVASLEGKILTKPGNFKNAFNQLSQCSGEQVTFYTGLALLNSHTDSLQLCVEPFTVQFRQLTDREIENYLNKEQPYDCAGSFKMEGLGIALFEKLEGEDPNSLIGLPLIQLISMLANEGVHILR